MSGLLLIDLPGKVQHVLVSELEFRDDVPV
jgi:hypothetical protein